MKTGVLRVSLLLSAFSIGSSWAGDPALCSGISNDAIVGPELDTTVPLALPSSLFNDFRLRLEAAVQWRDISAIAALYQTNGLGAEDLKFELARWQRVTRGEGKRVQLFGKELSKLPPKAHDFWIAQAQRLTEHEVANFVFVTCDGVQLTLPLAVAGDRLVILPSDKMTAKSGIEPSGAVNRSQPVRQETNQGSAAAGSGH